MNINAIQLPFIKPISVSLSAILLAAYGCIALWLCHGYFIWDFNVYLGLATAPFICTVNKGQFSRQYLIPAVLLCGLAVFLPVHSLLFMAMLFATLFLIENSIGKINHVILFLMLLVSPLFHYTIRLAELPVRFWLSAQVAALLTHIGMPASAAGNQIILKGYEFSVDPACAGLNMLATSLIICLFMVSFYQRQAKKQLHFLALAAMLIATIGLNIVCNYFRITFLVIFKVMPGTFFHDFVGMLCFILYVILPLMYGCKLIFKRLKQASPAKVADPDVFERIASLISSPLERE